VAVGSRRSAAVRSSIEQRAVTAGSTRRSGSAIADDARRGRHEPRTPARRDRAASVNINKPVDEVYAFWRDFENLPRFMRHLESVTCGGARRSHWVARGRRDDASNGKPRSSMNAPAS